MAYLKADNAGDSDRFGITVALNGDTLAVGAYSEEGHEGAVYVFVRSGTTWTQQQRLKANNRGTGDEFGKCIALSEDTLVVGAPYEDGRKSEGCADARGCPTYNGAEGTPDSGAVYVFVRSVTGWSQQAYIKPSASNNRDDHFGSSLALSGNTLAIGAPGEDSDQTTITATEPNSNDLAYNSGAVYVFVREGTKWKQEAYIKADNSEGGRGPNGGNKLLAEGDEFGKSLALSGNTLAVGAWKEGSSQTTVSASVITASDNGRPDSGAVYVYVRSGATWAQEAYLKADDAEAGDWFGTSLSLSGETLAVGAAGEDSSQTTTSATGATDNGASNSGAVYVFVRSGATWTQEAYLKADNAGSSDNFGGALSLSGGTLAVAAVKEGSSQTTVSATGATDNGALNSGAAYVFVRSGTAWTQEAYLKADNAEVGDRFGISLALSGDSMAVGADMEDSSLMGVPTPWASSIDNGRSNSGAVYVFELPPPSPVTPPPSPPPPSPPPPSPPPSPPFPSPGPPPPPSPPPPYVPPLFTLERILMAAGGGAFLAAAAGAYWYHLKRKRIKAALKTPTATLEAETELAEATVLTEAAEPVMGVAV